MNGTDSPAATPDEEESTTSRVRNSTRVPRVMVVDDEPNARDALTELLQDEGYEVVGAADGQQALMQLEDFDPDVILTDLKMPVLGGLDLIERGRSRAPHVAFIVMTAFGSIDTAVEAIKRGAENYLTKPLDLDATTALVRRAAEKAGLSREASDLRARLDGRLLVDNIVGEHGAVQRMLKTVRQVAPSRATVLIHGESGTGKELIAAALHHNSPRRDQAFVRLNCAALAETLLESELFGHERGSFTGASTRREGRFKQADGGTLFLDEISEVSPAVQVKLLRFLQEKEFERVGGNETLRVDVRVVAATNRDLKELVKEGLFREDLFYRLNVVQIDVPPLRVRKSDIPLLAHHFLVKYAAENGAEIRGFTDAALHALLRYPWPGNVRELENAIERAVVLCPGDLIGPEQFPTNTSEAVQEMGLLIPGVTLAELERMAILQTMDAVGHSTGRAAELLGISQRKVQYRLKEWGVTPARGGRDD